jgi:hypothetical protein
MKEDYSLDTSYTLNNEILSGDSSGLIKTAYVNSSSEWNSEWLGTEDG